MAVKAEAPTIFGKLRRRHPDDEVIRSTQLAFDRAFSLAPGVTGVLNSDFYSVTLANHLGQNHLMRIPEAVTDFLGVPVSTGGVKLGLEVHMAKRGSKSEVTIRHGQPQVKITIDGGKKPADVELRYRQAFLDIKGVDKQELAEELLDSIGDDLQSAREKFVRKNEEAKRGFLETVASEYGEGMVADLGNVINGLKLASDGQETLIDAMLGSTDYDERDGNIPRHIKVYTTLPLTEEVAKNFFNAVLPESNGARGGFHMGYDYSTFVESVVGSSPWILYQRPDGKIIGVTQSGENLNEKIIGHEIDFVKVLKGIIDFKLDLHPNFALLDYTGNLRNPPIEADYNWKPESK